MSASVSGSAGTRLSAWAAASMLLWITRTVLGLWIVYPLILAIQASGMANGPEGDAVLFQPGSLLLLELLRVGMVELGSGLKLSLLLGALSALAELVPLAVALEMLWLRGSPLASRLARAFGLFPKFVGLGAVALLAQAALLLGTSLLALGLKALLQGKDERLLSALPVALFGLGLLACAAVGSVLDIARAALVRRDRPARVALLWALTRLRQRPVDVLLGAYTSGAAGALATLSAAWFLTRIDLSGPSPRSLALGFGVHQFALLFAIGFRLRWLGTALELSGDHDG